MNAIAQHLKMKCQYLTFSVATIARIRELHYHTILLLLCCGVLPSEMKIWSEMFKLARTNPRSRWPAYHSTTHIICSTHAQTSTHSFIHSRRDRFHQNGNLLLQHAYHSDYNQTIKPTPTSGHVRLLLLHTIFLTALFLFSLIA